MNISLHVGLFTVLVTAKSHGSGVKFQLIRQKLTAESFNNSVKKNSRFNFQKYNNNNNPYPTAFPYGNGMVLHFYQQQESSKTKTVHKVINKGLKTYV